MKTAVPKEKLTPEEVQEEILKIAKADNKRIKNINANLNFIVIIIIISIILTLLMS